MASWICSHKTASHLSQPESDQNVCSNPPPVEFKIILPATSTNICNYFEYLNWGQAKNIYGLFKTTFRKLYKLYNTKRYLFIHLLFMFLSTKLSVAQLHRERKTTYRVSSNICSILKHDGYWRRLQWPRCLRRGSAAARWLEMWVRIPPEALRSVSCECCVLSSWGYCDRPTTRPEDPTECGVSECDRAASIMWRLCPASGCCVMNKIVTNTH